MDRKSERTEYYRFVGQAIPCKVYRLILDLSPPSSSCPAFPSQEPRTKVDPGDRRSPLGVDSGPPLVVPTAAGGLELGGGQEVEKGQPRMLDKLVSERLGLAAHRARSRLIHGDLLVVVFWSPGNRGRPGDDRPRHPRRSYGREGPCSREPDFQLLPRSPARRHHFPRRASNARLRVDESRLAERRLRP